MVPIRFHILVSRQNSARRRCQSIVKGARRPGKPGYGTPKCARGGGFPSPPEALHDACDVPASPRIVRLSGRTWEAVVWVPYVGFYPLAHKPRTKAMEMAKKPEKSPLIAPYVITYSSTDTSPKEKTAAFLRASIMQTSFLPRQAAETKVSWARSS